MLVLHRPVDSTVAHMYNNKKSVQRKWRRGRGAGEGAILPPPNFSLSDNFLFVGKLCFINTKLEAENPPFWWKLGAKSNFLTLFISVGNLEPSVGKLQPPA